MEGQQTNETPGGADARDCVPRLVRLVDAVRPLAISGSRAGKYSEDVAALIAYVEGGDLTDDLTNMIDEKIRKGSCETYDDWQAVVESILCMPNVKVTRGRGVSPCR